jgi:hypothetical protein
MDMCQNGIDFHGLMLALEQLAGREELLKKDVESWTEYLLDQEVPEAAEELRKAIDALDKVSESFSKALHELEHLHDHHGHDHHITATSFS